MKDATKCRLRFRFLGGCMKKLVLLLVILLSAGLLFAADIDWDKLPKGKWLDENWNAVWEIGGNSIRILDKTTGEEVFNFQDLISDFDYGASLTEAQFSFRCDEAERSYVFKKGFTNLDLTMEIKADWTSETYVVKMPFQK